MERNDPPTSRKADQRNLSDVAAIEEQLLKHQTIRITQRKTRRIVRTNGWYQNQYLWEKSVITEKTVQSNLSIYIDCGSQNQKNLNICSCKKITEIWES